LARLRLTNAARSDLKAIHRHSEEIFGLRQADAYGVEITKALRLIADYPQAARIRTDTARPVRAKPHKSHVIIYVLEDDAVVILRVRHASEDWVNDAHSLPLGDDA
jgi:toxin ParE1/3/4